MSASATWYIKRCGDAKFQAEWLRDTGQIDLGLISVIDEGASWGIALQTPWLDGEPPDMWGGHIYGLLQDHVWWGLKRWEPHITNVNQYVAHMHDVAPEFGDIWNKIPTLQLTWVKRVHGDCTRENIVDDIFIDPGRAWGLVCKENDEAKMMQSYYGWEEAKYGWKEMCGELPFEVTRAHEILYMSHLCRLLKHKHPRKAYRWAGQEILRMGAIVK